METPIADFVRRYADSGMIRAHMPGHKGKPFLGCETLDITEIQGADSLYEAEGIIRRSESYAGELFGSGRTVYSTEGSSQCIRAMLYLALTCGNGSRTVVAARNVHRAFVYSAALLDFEIVWLWPECSSSLCGCPVSPDTLERTLAEMPAPPAAVYLTSPDYLGGMADISALAEVCRKHGTLLAVDNAHGAYLKSLPRSLHPMDLGADLCSDSAHKTLPAPGQTALLFSSDRFPQQALRRAAALYGSSSPSYVFLAALDVCRAWMEETGERAYRKTAAAVERLRARGVRAGLIKLRVFRPFPAEELAAALAHVKAVAVLDKSEGNSACGGPLFAETRCACYDLPHPPKMIDVVYGLAGRDCAVEDVERVYRRLLHIVQTGETGPRYVHMGQRSKQEEVL